MGEPEAPATAAASSGPASSGVTSSTSSPASGAPSDGSLPVAIGDVIADKYRVDRYLGRGGVGIVVQATHLRLNQRVAIKLLLSTAMSDAVARFLREAQAAVRLKSEHVARVLDVGELPNGAPYMVMEFLEGSDLDDLIRNCAGLPIPIQDAVHYVLDACEAMAEAHAAGIVHRDLKPANLFLTTQADGGKSIKVLDFGISKDDGLGDSGQSGGMKLTKTTTVFGSPLYMSPEQMRSARLTDARSDIWSLGVILYELVTGTPPFDAEMYPDLVFKVNMEAPAPPSSIRRDLPSKLEAAILRCLEKDASKRFQDVGKLAAAIAPFGPADARASAERAQRVLDASRAAMPSLAQTGMESGGSPLSKTDGPWAAGSARSARPKTGLLVGAAAVSAAVIIGAVVFFTRAPEPQGRDIAPASDGQQATVTDSAPSADPNGIRVVPATEASPQAPNPPPPGVEAPSPTAAQPSDPRKAGASPTSTAASPTSPAAPSTSPTTTPAAPQPGPTPKAAGPAETPPKPTQPGAPPTATSDSNRDPFNMVIK